MKIFFILTLLCPTLFASDCFSQIKLSEGFEGATFPPQGWRVVNIVGGNGQWTTSPRTTRSGNKCAVSNFTSTGSNNFLITKRITPTIGDSLTFYFRQTFWSVYKDTFRVYISNTDSLVSSMTTLLFSIRDSISYPSPLTYGRFAVNLNSFAGQTVWIGFQHKNLDGDNIRIDDISIGNSIANEVGVTDNVFPEGTFSTCSNDMFIPKATITNFGSNNQSTPFNVTYSVTGPISYQNVVQATINAGQSKTITFDTLIATLPGIYNIKIFTSLTTDQNRSNDTLKTTFTIVNANYGGGLAVNGGYYFSNSTSCASVSQSQPEYCWKDTLGSVDLIVNGVDVSGGLLTGNLDNGFFSLGNILYQSDKIKFFGTQYDSIFISTNGLLGFTEHSSLLSSNPNQLTSHLQHPVAAIYSLWCDMDFGNAAVTGSRLSYKVAGDHLIITFNKAPLKSGGQNDYVSFQTCLEIVNTNSPDSKIILQYDLDNSGQSFITKFADNSISSHFVGIKNISGNSLVKYRYKDTTGLHQYGPLYNESLALEFGTDALALNDKCSKLDLRVLLEEIFPVRDTISLLIRDSNAPYNILESKKLYFDNYGNTTTSLSIPSDNYNYYLVITHRNSMETWSRNGGETFGAYYLNYDFTTEAAKAYGNNLLVREYKAYIYTGDVDQNGFIDVSDLVLVHNDALLMSSGYRITDLNGDGIVDVSDVLACHNNTLKMISVQSP